MALKGAIEAVDLYRFFHAGEAETLALRGASLRVDPGEMVALIGPSGSGKSTLLNCLAGLDEPDGGYVLLQGERLTRRPEAERARRRAASIGILLQSDNLFETLSVADNLRLQMDLAHRVDEARLAMLLERTGLGGRRDALPAQLSGGELARAGLAVALAAAPAVLLADEPTGEVDAETEAGLLDFFAELRAGGMAALVATHSQALARRADRVVTIEDGRITDGHAAR
ncbi:MAG TPA: ABC transporter ATP-binding protein [Burkholderiales bacterium]|nr:ABC transporter ATP-binding protein [Burkholderiales bacterium]